jgi:hypothetical protein
MKCKIKYAVNGKDYDEEVNGIVIFDKKGKQAAYIYKTIWDDLGFCIMNSRTKEAIMVGKPED